MKARTVHCYRCGHHQRIAPSFRACSQCGCLALYAAPRPRMVLAWDTFRGEEVLGLPIPARPRGYVEPELPEPVE